MKDTVNKEYRLVELRATNVKALKAVAVHIDGTVLKINGRNGAGKSSVLDAVAMAIGGPKAFPLKPIRRGQDKAEIFLDFGGLKLTRRLWEKDGGGIGQDLVLEYSDGKRPKERQTVLDALRGSPIADDPIEFATKLKPKERYDLLKSLVPGYDFEAKAKERQALFDDRTGTGRLRDRAVAAAAAAVVPPNAPAEPPDVTGLMAKLREATETNRQIDQRRARREGFADELEAMRDRADQMASELKKLQEDIAAREKQIDEAEELPPKIDTSSIEQQLQNMAALSEAYSARRQKTELQASADKLTAEYDSQSASIEALDQQKAKAIKTAKLPVPELSFGNDDIMLDGLPFDQASTARKIRVSTALLMALKPDLRVLLVREGSLLDDDARAALEADAKANDFVVLMECVGAGDGTGIVIENGEIAP